MSITNFKSALVQGGARPNQFVVFLQMPGAFGALAAESQFLCEAASLPGSSINPAIIMYRGREVKLSGERRFDNWQVTIINDSGFSLHNSIEAWMHRMNHLKNNTGELDPVTYTADLRVAQLDRNNNYLKEYTIKNSWPVSMSPIQLGFDQNDMVEKFQVEFAYDWFAPSTLPDAY